MAKRGRPPVDDPRGKKYLVRVNKKELGLLDNVRKMTGMNSAADVFRTALERMYREEAEKERRRKNG